MAIGYINKIEGNVPGWGREKDCFLSKVKN